MFMFSTMLPGRCRAGVVVVFPLVLLLGCSHNEKEPQMRPAAGVRTPASPPASSAGEPQPTVSSSGSFNVSERVRTRCNLPDEPAESPQFDFDDAGLRDRGNRILNGVAECATKGALKNENLTIVGHTDPRGPDEYNQDLGMRRAQTARDYLASQGVPQARLIVQSRGELDATGTDESGWQLDRRIDIDTQAPAAGP